MNFEDKIKETLSGKILESGQERDQYWIKVRSQNIIDVLTSLKECPDLAFDFLTDICGVDNFPNSERFQVIYHLLSSANCFRIRIKVDVPNDTLIVPSVVSVWKGANWLEREVYDMYGVRFSGHPDLRRILMHEDFLDYPQRKDFPLKGWREEVD